MCSPTLLKLIAPRGIEKELKATKIGVTNFAETKQVDIILSKMDS